ncbi:MAG: TRC40/GET3/ArsA family transport-energizing ATPase [bacterium]
MRIILYTGKGGVGKTSISAATALLSARHGHRTLIISTDPAHSLSDCFDLPVGQQPTPITDGLDAQEVDVNKELSLHWGNIHDFIVKFLKKQGFEHVMAEEFAIFPGMEELFSLLRLKGHVEQEVYDTCILDCAPTGSTIRMLSFPDFLGWHMERFFPLERRIIKTLRPVAERITKVPLPDDAVFSSVEELYQKIEGMRDILTDPTISSVRIVSNAEKMVIQESQRAYTYLNLFGFPVDCIIVNRLLPEDVTDPYLARWKTLQQGYLDETEKLFHDLPIFTGRLFQGEIVGLKQLERLGRDVFGGQDPTAIFISRRPIEFGQDDGEHFIRIHLPGFDPKALDMWVRAEELIIQAGSFKRHILLPRTYAGRRLREAAYRDDHLTIHFGGEDHGGEEDHERHQRKAKKAR